MIFWNTYYKQWVNVSSFPRLIIRYEDLLFHPKKVIDKVCQCGGGKINTAKFTSIKGFAKNHGSTFNKAKNKMMDDVDILLSFIHGSWEIRDAILSDRDKQ